jgi:hypothetical protein
MTHDDDAQPDRPAAECAACPLCAGLAALRQAAPEVVEHLLKAGAELVLAARVLLEGAAPDDQREPRPAGARMRRIDVG